MHPHDAVDDLHAHRAVEALEVDRQRVEVTFRRDLDDGVGADRALELGRRVEREDAAAIHDRHPVTEAVRLFHVVRREQDRLPGLVQLAQYLPQGEPALRVEAGRGLVEEEDPGPVEDRPGHHQALGHTAGKRVGVGRRAIGQAKVFERLIRGLLGFAPAHPEVQAVEEEVLAHGEAAVERVGLGHHADDLLGQAGVGPHVDAADDRFAARRNDAGREHADRRRLARAVGPQQAEDLALVHLEVERVDREDVTRVDLGQRLGPDDRRRFSRHESD